MLELKLIALYLYICEVYDTELRHHCQRFSPNSSPAFTDEELLTVFLFAIMEEQKLQIKSIWRYTARYWRDWFPALPTYQKFNYRLNRMAPVFPYLLQRIIDQIPPGDALRQDISLIDSFPIMTCSHKRQGKVAPNLTDKGYCATKSQHYYGMKLHLIGFFQPGALPRPEWIKLSPASWHDLQAVKPILLQLRDRTIFADKIYAHKAFNEQLTVEQNCQILTPVKLQKGQSLWERQWNHAGDKAFSTTVSKVRQAIESIFNWFIEKVDLQRASKVRSENGLIVHLFGRLAAAFASILFAKS